MSHPPPLPIKHDGDKPRVDLIPTRALLVVGRAFGHGAKKYADDNWRSGAGMSHRRLLGATLRHCYQWASGEDNDPESGLPHLAHAAASVLMLLDLALHNHGVDDRWVPPVEEVYMTDVIDEDDTTWTSTRPTAYADFGGQVVSTAYGVNDDGR